MVPSPLFTCQGARIRVLQATSRSGTGRLWVKGSAALQPATACLSCEASPCVYLLPSHLFRIYPCSMASPVTV